MGGDGSSPLKIRCRNSIPLDALTSCGDATPGAASLARTVASSICQRNRTSFRSVMRAPGCGWVELGVRGLPCKVDARFSALTPRTLRWAYSLGAARHDEIADRDLHGLAVLIHGRGSYLDDSLIG